MSGKTGPNTLETGLPAISMAMFHKKGVYQSKTGYNYQGQWTNNLKNGNGKMTYADGKIYDGQFVDNKREGEGK